MRHTKIPLADTKAFSQFFLDYLQQKESLKPFYEDFPIIENFNKSLTKKASSYSPQTRKILVDSLSRQYKNLQLSDQVRDHLRLLSDDKTFTVTTGHQLNIFTGPLYFIYKIVTVINTCKILKQQHPEFNFVPVYWMASEDHDYDEIKSFRLYGKKYTWETKQSGAVGRFNTKGLDELVDQIPGELDGFREAYKKHERLSDAVRYYVNHLFASEGVVVIDADDYSLKSCFKEVIRQDIATNVTHDLVNQTDKKLEQLGYKTQIFCRDINFFYLDEGVRSRIEKRDDKYIVLDTDLKFSSEELNKLIDQKPERFSPNVILRPLYQEIILPNLAYIGGPAEVIYWLQLKEVFNHFGTPFPILMPRNFAMVLEHTTERKFSKTGLEYKDLFEEKNYIYNHWVVENARHDLTVGQELSTVLKAFEQLRTKAESIDKTLGAYVGAESKRAEKSIQSIERKLLRAEKRLHTDKLRQIESVKDTLFPNGSLQERVDNFLNFYQQDTQFISKLIQHFDPFDYNFNVLSYGE
jgi:bacillithiol synthase